jgi:proline iminopeptidase
MEVYYLNHIVKFKLLISGANSMLSNIENYLDVPDGRIWYNKFYTPENENKIPLIILHGGPGIPHNYLTNLSAMATLVPVIFYDQLGCGKSKVQENNNKLWELSRFIDELEILINHLGHIQIYLFGHSWGGALAVKYTSKNPHKVKKLMLASPLLNTKVWMKDANYLLNQLPIVTSEVIRKHELSRDFDSQEYQDATYIFYQNYLCRMPEWPESLNYSFQNMNPNIYSIMWGPSEFLVTGNLINFDCLDDLNVLTMETLITCGKFDEARPESMHGVLSFLPNGKLVIFEKSAHLAHLEEGDKYLRVLKEFINEE